MWIVDTFFPIIRNATCNLGAQIVSCHLYGRLCAILCKHKSKLPRNSANCVNKCASDFDLYTPFMAIYTALWPAIYIKLANSFESPNRLRDVCLEIVTQKDKHICEWSVCVERVHLLDPTHHRTHVKPVPVVEQRILIVKSDVKSSDCDRLRQSAHEWTLLIEPQAITNLE